MLGPDDVTDSYDRAKPNRWITCLVVLIVLIIFLAVLAYYIGGTTENAGELQGTAESVGGAPSEENDG